MAQNLTGVKETTPQPSITFRIFKCAEITASGLCVRMQNTGDSAMGGYSLTYAGMAAAVSDADTIPVGVSMHAVSAAAAAAGAYIKIQTGGPGQQALLVAPASTNTVVGSILYAAAAGAAIDVAVASAAARSSACMLGHVLAVSSTVTQAAGTYMIHPVGRF